MTFTLVEDERGLKSALDALRDAADIAVDTEFMRLNTYHPRVALLQLGAGGRAWLIDPLAVGDAHGIRELLTDPTRRKVLHSAGEDLAVFRHWLGVVPEPLIDTQRAAALLGEPFGLGYRALMEALLGVVLDKGETRSDWLRRPLSAAQLDYAARDVLPLASAWSLLAQRAQAQGRMDWVLEEGRAVFEALKERERQGWRRLKSAGKLSRRSLAALREVYAWREQRAEQVDKPRGWVLADKACIAIAKTLPERREQLAELDVLPPAVLRRQGERLLACVERARDCPEDQLPPAPLTPLNESRRRRLKALRERMLQRAAELAVAPEMLLSGADLELLVREQAGEPIAAPARWRGWRAAVIDDLRREAPPAVAAQPPAARLVEVFRSPVKAGMYLYVDRREGLGRLPPALRSAFGEPQSVLVLSLHAERRLARAQAREVLRQIAAEGYYLQMPPAQMPPAADKAGETGRERGFAH